MFAIVPTEIMVIAESMPAMILVLIFLVFFILFTPFEFFVIIDVLLLTLLVVMIVFFIFVLPFIFEFLDFVFPLTVTLLYQTDLCNFFANL